MKKFITGLLVLFTQNSQAQQIWKYEDSLFTFEVAVDSVLSYDNSDYNYMAMNICVKNVDGKLVQNISLDNIGLIFSIYDSSGLFKIEDVNFDGHHDIGIQTWQSTRLDNAYQFWCYDSLSGKFKADSCLSHIMNPEFNDSLKIICSFVHYEGMEHSYRKYKWKSDSLMMYDERSSLIIPVEKYRRGPFKPKGAKAYSWETFIEHRWLEGDVWKDILIEAEYGQSACPCDCQ